MIVTFNWIKDLLETKASPEDVAFTLTNLGIEVEQVVDVRGGLEPFVVAKIESAEPHPSIKKLSVCQVSVGKGDNIQVVCGASNARAGLITVLAPVGSSIPSNGMLIEPRIIGGVQSCGMLCSAVELMLEKHLALHDGIIELESDAVIGSKLLNCFDLNDVTFYLNITPNRGDCLSVYGLARELAASGIGSLRQVASCVQELEVKRASIPEECLIFSLWHIKGACNLKTPNWIAQRLTRANIDLINAPVDIANYVAHTFGQPMHVYDAATLGLKEGSLPQIEKRKGYTLNALDGNSYKVEQEALSVTCSGEVIALAGIIGSENTKVTAQTREILLESASFKADQIAKTGQALKLHTQARHRFERGVDSDLCIKAAQIAVKMILDVCGGFLHFAECIAGTSTICRKIGFNQNSIEQVLGFDVPEPQVKLESLGCKVNSSSETWHVEVPSWRSDICVEEDLIAEIGRMHGYENIPPQPLAQGRVSCKANENLIRELCLRLGYLEVISWSFYSKKQVENFGLKGAIEIENPISQEMSHMRESIIPNMLDIWHKNRARGAKGISIFEVGPVFHNAEKLTLALLKAGQVNEVSPHAAAQNADIFDIKGDIQQIFDSIEQEVEWERASLTACHPHKCAAIKISGKEVGYIGTLMPSSKGPEVSFAEIYLSEIAFVGSSKKKKWEVCNYQPVQRDFAFLIDKRSEIGPILSAIKNADPNAIKEVALFDVFQGEGIPETKKSFAVSCTFQSSKGTLSEKEIVALQEKVVLLVVQKFGAEPRI
jgi:phenylalanyl-tRNA synthetase beta chain